MCLVTTYIPAKSQQKQDNPWHNMVSHDLCAAKSITWSEYVQTRETVGCKAITTMQKLHLFPRGQQ